MPADFTLEVANHCLDRYDAFDHNSCCEHTQCCGCGHCTHNCLDCLHKMHWIFQYPELPSCYKNRIYDCPHMADVYVCKFSCKFSTEFLRALQQCPSLHNESKVKVFSLGCGPCTDLFAIDVALHLDILHYDFIEYLGVDYSEKGWKHIHQDIQDYQDDSLQVKFGYQDITKGIKNLIKDSSWVPNIISLQYVLSDMVNHQSEEQMHAFIDDLAQYINSIQSDNLVIILNDVNYGKCRSDEHLKGRDYFEELLTKLENVTASRYYFANTSPYTPSTGYHYGSQYTSNNLVYTAHEFVAYEPRKYCNSAQMIIYKGEKAQGDTKISL